MFPPCVFGWLTLYFSRSNHFHLEGQGYLVEMVVLGIRKFLFGNDFCPPKKVGHILLKVVRAFWVLLFPEVSNKSDDVVFS